MRCIGHFVPGALAFAALAGCEAMVPPPASVVPPFQVTETGAGFSPGTVGSPVRFLEGERADGSLRIATRSVRVYSASGARLGRVRAASAGFVLERRDGTDVCSFEFGDAADVMRCGTSEWRILDSEESGAIVLIAPDGQRVRVEGGLDAAHAALASGVRVEAARDGSRVSIAAGPWQRTAIDVAQALDARGVVLREVVRSSTETDAELLAAGVAWMHHHRQRMRGQQPAPAEAPPVGEEGAAQEATANEAQSASPAAQNAPPSFVTTGSGSSTTTAEGSAADSGR